MSYKVAAADVAPRATLKVSFGRAEAARREFLYMKLYMDGVILMGSHVERKCSILRAYEGGFLCMECQSQVQNFRSCRGNAEIMKNMSITL